MPVDSQHVDYQKNLCLWARIDDVVSGQDSVKAKGEVYLPKVSSKQKNTKYEVYKSNAYFLEATGRTIDGLLGLVFRRAPATELPTALQGLKDNATLSGIPWNDFCQQVVEGVLSKARYGVLVEYSQERARPFVRGYEAEDIINWRCEILNGVETLSLVVLREVEDEISEDGFEVTQCYRYRVLRLLEGVYTQSVYCQAKTEDNQESTYWEETEISTPSVRGKFLTEIPFVFFGPKNLTPYIEKSPVLPLVNANLAHYRRWAEWSLGLRMVALPTPYVTGYQSPEGSEPQEIGPDVMLEYPDPNAHVGMMEVSGAGLGLIRQDLKDLESHMANLGAQLLEQEKKEAEAAETLRLRQAGRSATLTTIASTGSLGLTRVLQFAAQFLRQDPAKVRCVLNNDFFDAEMPTDKLTALVASWQQGAITRKTLVWNLKKGELLEENATVQDYLEELDAEERKIRARARPHAD